MLKEGIILCLGGQGGVTAGRILALACVKDGLYAQAIPHFGAERRGALVKNYFRLSDKPIRRHSPVKRGDFVVVFAEKILNLIDVKEILKEDGLVILNSKRGLNGLKCYYVNASEIALRLNLVSAGWPIVNTAMVGAIARVLNLSLDSVLSAVEDTFGGRLADINKKAVEIAYGEVKSWSG